MKRKKSNILKKTVKIAGFTCVALGGAALIGSGAALKALGEGAKFLKDTVRKIMGEEQETAGGEASVEAELCDPV